MGAAVDHVAVNQDYGFDPDFEAVIAYLCANNTDFFNRLGHAIDPLALATAPASLVVKACQEIGRERGVGPSSDIIVVQRVKRWVRDGKATYEDVAAAVDVLDYAEELGLPKIEDVINEAAPLVRERVTTDALSDAIGAVGASSDKQLQKALRIVAEARSLGQTDSSLGTAIGIGSIRAMTASASMALLPTEILELDFEIKGGAPRAGICVVGGDTGHGKSIFLNHISAAGVMRGLFVAYASVELPEAIHLARLQAAITGVPTNDLLAAKPEALKLYSERIHVLQTEDPKIGLGLVKEFPPDATTVADIAAWIDRIALQYGRSPDLVVIDYADRMIAPSIKTDYHAMKLIYKDLKALRSVHNCWLWTASQVKGDGGKKRHRIESGDLSDSRNKAKLSILIVTINPKQMAEGGTGYSLYVAKATMTEMGGETPPLVGDRTLGRFSDSNVFGRWEEDQVDPFA